MLMSMQQVLLAVNPSSLHGFDPARTSAALTLSSSNSVITKNSGFNIQGAVSAASFSTEDIYAEFEWVLGTSSPFSCIGICTGAYTPTNQLTTTAYDWVYYQQNGDKYHNSVGASYGVASTTGDIIQVWYKGSTGELYFGKNDTVMNSGDPVAGTNPAYAGLSGTFYLVGSAYSPSPASVTRFVPVGSHSYSPRTGFTAID